MIAQGNALGSESRRIVSPVRAIQRAVRVYSALSGLTDHRDHVARAVMKFADAGVQTKIAMDATQLGKLFEGKSHMFVVLEAADFHRIFAGPQLSSVEREFKTELWKAGGPMFNPGGTSQSDKLMKFCSDHHLSFRWVKHRVVFYTGNQLPDDFLRGIENGAIPSLACT
jgi:hypothetical protein